MNLDTLKLQGDAEHKYHLRDKKVLYDFINKLLPFCLPCWHVVNAVISCVSSHATARVLVTNARRYNI
jgi:hypothetical protein